jgi:hypothetical protein
MTWLSATSSPSSSCYLCDPEILCQTIPSHSLACIPQLNTGTRPTRCRAHSSNAGHSCQQCGGANKIIKIIITFKDSSKKIIPTGKHD